MFGIGIPEFILILVVGLIVFGPSKLPEIGRYVGKGLREFRKASSAFQNILNAPEENFGNTMAKTHNAEKSATETVVSEKKEKTEETSVDEKNEKEKTTEQIEAVTLAENAYGYTPPTKESVQAEIDAKKNVEHTINNSSDKK